MGCCGNAKGHCRNAPCNSSIAAMMQQREHCGNALQYCGNTCCGNVEGHCKQHQHCGNIAAIRALKRYCGNALRHCSNTCIAAMRRGIAAIRALPQCAEALQQYPIAAMRCRVAAALQQRDSCGGGCQLFPRRLVVAVGLLAFVGRGAR